jgi:cell division protein FtsB
MKEKIKNLLAFCGRAWRGGVKGKFGLLLALFALIGFARMFMGKVSVQNFAMAAWRLEKEQAQLAAEQEKLAGIERHIELFQNYSPDYIEEVSLKYLNMGDPKTRIIK